MNNMLTPLQVYPPAAPFLSTKLRWNTLCLALCASGMLSACALPLIKQGELQDHMAHTLERAAQERTTVTEPERIDPALMPPLTIETPQARPQTETRFDLSVVNAPASQVFMALVSGTPYSMLLPADLSGNLTVNLKNVTLVEALDTIRDLYGYEYSLKGTRVFIQSNSLQTRIFRINYLVSQRKSTSNLRVASTTLQASGGSGSSGSSRPTQSAGGAGQLSTSDTSSVSTSTDVSFWAELENALKSIVVADKEAEGGEKRVHINRMSGVIVVRASPIELRSVETYLKATQLVVERQVMLEAKIIAVTLSNATQTGINWSIFNSKNSGRSMLGVMGPNAGLTTKGEMTLGSGLSVTPGKGGSSSSSSLTNGFVGLAFQTPNFAALLSFLETQGDVAVLSSPRIATLNNQKALLKVGKDDMYVVNVSGGTPTTTSVAGTPPTLDLQPFFSGISLDVTPQVDDDGNIILHVHPTVSQVSEIEKVIDLGANGGIMKLPQPSSDINESDSIVRVQNGHIVAIGGLMKQQQDMSRSQLPGAGESALSYLFGQRSTSASKTEMVILIRPTIIDGDKPWQEDLKEVSERVQNLDRRKLLPPPAEPRSAQGSSWVLEN